jgi:hypothetical protein
MKGIVFTEFLELVESKFGYEMVDSIIQESDLPHAGAYTSIGTYPHSEIVMLVTQLSRKTDIPVSELLRIYGRHLFGVFSKSYSHFFEGVTSAFGLLEHVENHIHVSVRKLYPDAELPRFSVRMLDEYSLEMIYHSERRLADLAMGLIESALEHFQEKASILREDLNPDGSTVRFLIVKQTSKQ